MGRLKQRDEVVSILVKATTVHTARAASADVASKIVATTITKYSKGYYLITGKYAVDELTGDFYSKIWASDKLALVSDTTQETRRSDILKESNTVEACLRMLLLRANEFIEDYFNLFLSDYTTKHAKVEQIIMAKKTDPMTSLLSFEKMEDILGQDISWLGTPLTGVQHLQKIIEDVNDFDELRKRLSEKLAPKTVWDVIMGKLLIKPYSWQEVAGDIKEIRRLRNDAAHMHTLTPADVRDAAKVRKSLMIKIDEANQVKDPELSYYEFPELAAITKNLGLWQANLFKNIGFTSVSPQFITEGLLPSTKIANAMQAFMPSGSEAMMTASKLLYNQQEASRKAMGAVFTQQQASQKILQSAVLQQQQAAQKIIKNAIKYNLNEDDVDATNPTEMNEPNKKAP